MTQARSVAILKTPSEGVQTDQFDKGETLTARTENSTYKIKVSCGGIGDVLVVGGRHFPHTTRCKLLGASVGSLLKVRAVCVGLCMEFLHEGRRIVTSPVIDITIE
jgi:hypothetical protein